MTNAPPSKPLLLGIYIDPPVWIDIAPSGLPEGADPIRTTSAMSDEVFRRRLNESIEVSATREGLIAFEVSQWAPAIEATPRNSHSFDTHADHTAVLNRATLLNTFLAFFYTHEDRRGATHQRMFVTPEVLLRFNSPTEPVGTFTTSEGLNVAHLTRSSDLATYDPTKPFHMDSRILFRKYPNHSNVIPLSTLDDTLNSMEAVLTAHPTDGLLMTELFHRASKSYQDHSFSTSLIINWSIAEKILREIWFDYLATKRESDSATHINHDRLSRLRQGREYTAAVITEILSLTGSIDLTLYKHLNEIRTARNRWMHGLDGAISIETAHSSAQLAEIMLLRGRNIDLHAQNVLTWSS